MREASWAEKHRPSDLRDVLGNPAVLAEMEGWLSGWRRGARAMLLHGPAGCGKTTAVYALAAAHGLEVVELNASDFRRKDDIEAVMGMAAVQMSLSQRERLLLLDEVDGIEGNADRGGVPAVVQLVRTSCYPVILTANEVDHPRLRPLRSLCALVRFQKPRVEAVAKALRRVADAEGYDADGAIIGAVASRADGDIRAAINDLQTVLVGGATKEAVEALGDRDVTRTLPDAIRIVLKTRALGDALGAVDDLSEDPDMVFSWLSHNVALEYEDPEDRARALDALSRADVFRGRISRGQNWRFLVYVNDLMAGGVALAKRERYHKFVKYEFPPRIALMARTKEQRALRDAAAEKVARRCHTSRRVAIDEYLPLLARVLRRAPEAKGSLGLSEDELSFVAGAEG